MTEQMLGTSERKILRRLSGPMQGKECWPIRWNSAIYNLHKDLNIVSDVKVRRIRWAGHTIRMETERSQ